MNTIEIEIKGNEIEITTPNEKERKQLTIQFNQNEIEIGNGGNDIVNAIETTLIQYQGEEYELTRKAMKYPEQYIDQLDNTLSHHVGMKTCEKLQLF